MSDELIKPSDQFRREIEPALDDYLKDVGSEGWRIISPEQSTTKLIGRLSITRRSIPVALMVQRSRNPFGDNCCRNAQN